MLDQEFRRRAHVERGHEIVRVPAELHRYTVFALSKIVTLADIVERVEFHHEMVHAAARSLRNSEAMMAGVDVHEIERHRRTHEVSDPKAQQVPIEFEGRIDVGHHQHRMPHALRPGTETPDMPCGAEWFIGDLGTVERLNAVAR